MSESAEKKGRKTKTVKIENFNPKQKKSNASEKTREEEAGTSEKIGTKLMDELDGLELGEVYTGIENLIKKTKALDEKITQNAGTLLSKVTGHFRNSINSFKNKK